MEGNTTLEVFTIITKAEKTNLWKPATADPNMLLTYVLPAAAFVVFLGVVALLLHRKRKQANGLLIGNTIPKKTNSILRTPTWLID